MTHAVARTDGPSISERFAGKLSGISYGDLPGKAREIAINDLLDCLGLCIAVRRTDYVQRLVNGWDSTGDCTALGQTRNVDAAGAALINGTAIHGEDFDDTLEGAPIRVGAMVIPGVLAACERFGSSGKDLVLGITIGLETICRLNHVAAGKIHKQGFHPVGVIGPLGSAAGVCASLGFDSGCISNAFAIAASMSSGILEYLAEGAWTKRLHPGWAAHSGFRAALFAAQKFNGPRRVFEGEHGFFRAFAPTATAKYQYVTEGVGEEWLMEDITFKPYACGTMIHPYIDCMIRLAQSGVDADEIVEIECETGEGLVHRLWEPLADKHQPPSGYAAKFSMPWCMAVGFFERNAGLEQFTDEKARDPQMLKLAAKIHYIIDPENEYPDNYTGHIRVTLQNGKVIELRQPHMRGGRREPLSRDELVRKFRSNITYGGWPQTLGEKLLSFCLEIETKSDLTELRQFRF